jgi:hypothetical protein
MVDGKEYDDSAVEARLFLQRRRDLLLEDIGCDQICEIGSILAIGTKAMTTA